MMETNGMPTTKPSATTVTPTVCLRGLRVLTAWWSTLHSREGHSLPITAWHQVVPGLKQCGPCTRPEPYQQLHPWIPRLLTTSAPSPAPPRWGTHLWGHWAAVAPFSGKAIQLFFSISPKIISWSRKSRLAEAGGRRAWTWQLLGWSCCRTPTLEFRLPGLCPARVQLSKQVPDNLASTLSKEADLEKTLEHLIRVGDPPGATPKSEPQKFGAKSGLCTLTLN